VSKVGIEGGDGEALLGAGLTRQSLDCAYSTSTIQTWFPSGSDNEHCDSRDKPSVHCYRYPASNYLLALSYGCGTSYGSISRGCVRA